MQPAASAEPWQVEIGLLSYTEKDRNTGVEFLLDAKRVLRDDDEFSLGVEIDTLTGATPNGATASNVPQTFTRSSGNGSYSVGANQLPVDDTHMDTRLAVESAYKDQRTSDLAITYSGRMSMEFDYLSFGLGNSYELDFNQKNTRLYLGFNGEHNRVHPVGNIPDELGLMTPPGELQNRNAASTTRTAAEASVGLTQVIDKRSLFQLRYTRSRFEGYLNDPYKLLSVVDEQNQENPGETVEYRFENRPDQRNINTFFLAYKRDIQAGIVEMSIRRSEDDWNLDATALDFRYRHHLRSKAYLEPHLRLYRQSEAEFFRHSLLASEELPANASADSRLADFDAVTVGLKFGTDERRKSHYSIAVEYYTQAGDNHPDSAVGLQTAQNLFPRLHVLLAKLTYSTRW